MLLDLKDIVLLNLFLTLGSRYAVEIGCFRDVHGEVYEKA